MICDVETRVWSAPRQLGDAVRRNALQDGDGGNEERLIASCRGVDRAFVLGFRSAHLGADIGADFVMQVVRRHPDRLLGVVGIDPLLADWPQQLERGLDAGCIAVAVSPSLQHLPPTHSAAMRLWESCGERRVPVFASRGLYGPASLPPSAALAFDRPELWEEPLRAVPDLTLVLAGLGWPFVDEALAMMAKHPRIFAHVAGLARRPLDAYRYLWAALDLGVADRLLFASGFPAESAGAAIAALQELPSLVAGTALPALPRRTIRGIIERDALFALGLSPAPTGLSDAGSDSPLSRGAPGTPITEDTA